MPETTLSLTEHEILALLSFNDTESADYSREVLRLSDVGARDTLVRAGLSTLLVREHASLQGADLVLAGPAGLIAGIFATAGAWLEIAVTTDEASFVLFAVQSAGGAFVMSVGTHGVHQFNPLPQDRPVLSFALDVARHYLGSTEPGGKLSVRAKHHGLGVDPHSATLLRNTDGAVRLAEGDSPEPALTEPAAGAEIEDLGRLLALDEQ
ncbi:hypothetical protein GM708_07095 [Vibrio cholerae]|jgi:hypothetical protein|nr:hypothetical protein [Vibrio cholerae]